FSPDGRRLASATSTLGKDEIIVWDLGRRREAVRFRFGGPESVNFSLAFSPDGKGLASGNYNKLIKVFDTASGRPLFTLGRHQGSVPEVAFSPDGRRLASASSDQSVKVWDAEQGYELYTIRGHANWVSSVSFRPYGDTLASASWDGTVKLWDVYSGY